MLAAADFHDRSLGLGLLARFGPLVEHAPYAARYHRPVKHHDLNFFAMHNPAKPQALKELYRRFGGFSNQCGAPVTGTPCSACVWKQKRIHGVSETWLAVSKHEEILRG